MDTQTFKRVLTTFADSPTSVDFAKGKLLCEVRDEMIEADISSREGELYVREGEVTLPANKWLFQRIARLPILADRIITAFPEPDYFISPNAELLDNLENENEGALPMGDASEMTLEVLNRKPAGSSSVVYLTSDAGEGKTTLIAHLARAQAVKFKQKESDWLLLPISLGGRPFLRFDDIVVGFLTNKLRFPLFYFDAFMELVRLGVLVPAFDGFEEMFIQNASGDALSAVGSLMRTLESSGTVLIAARKAYFEYQDIKTQARLFDSIGNSSVIFSRLSLQRWARSEFIAYAIARGSESPEATYSRVAERLGHSHPLLTRAVLVKRLLDVAESVSSLSELLQRIGSSPHDYFAVFVRAIIEREALEKWIDTSGEAAKPLLAVADHFTLLSSIAQEMWNLGTDSLPADVLDLLTDLFCETRHLPAAITFQVKERTKQHALIVNVDVNRNTFAFDHEEFKNFFLGEAVGATCVKADFQRKQELLSILRRGALPAQANQAALSYIRRSESLLPIKVAQFLQEVAQLDGPSSFTHENAGHLVIGVISGQTIDSLLLKGLGFPVDILRDSKITNIAFQNCSFAGMSLENAHLSHCSFQYCHFERLELHSTTIIEDCDFNPTCDIGSILPVGRDVAVFDPHAFPILLRQAGFSISIDHEEDTLKFDFTEDEQMKLFRRLLRHFFLRSTHINENVLLRKLGPEAHMFVKNVIPQLINGGVLSAEWIARDRQNRYQLAMSMERISRALLQSHTNIASFLRHLEQMRE